MRAATIGLVCLLALSAAACGSSGHRVTTTSAQPAPTPVDFLTTCLTKDGYSVVPESPGDVETAPPRFGFTAVWNVLNPSRVALALTFSRSIGGAEQATEWTRQTNARLAKGALKAPVIRIGKINVLWTSTPGARNKHDVYGCIHRAY